MVTQLDWWRQNKEQPEQIIPNSVNMVLSIVKPPKLELRPLPNHLKYGYLGKQNTLPVIIVASIDAKQEEALLNVLKIHKKAIGWTLVDIKGTSLAFCKYKIRLEGEKDLW
ncbi:Retrovirus-related Pol polyprotein from transposon 412 family [Gossypium australe]|uniref:Retrovirus-related Pol polyprotein from transposon 412 family n=1 Tax=Gossypium australe TaxID=47621 RepID=A0A5B6WGN0_9ROSI|nr:Retrovirus-related Pol polyprotein from transposon 412 family [Gossypium australe]